MEMVESFGTENPGDDPGGIVIGNRVVVIGRTAPAKEKTSNLQPTKQRPTTHRTVVIRNGRLVRSRPDR